MKSEMKIAIIGILITVICLAGIWLLKIYTEQNSSDPWNNGICPECGGNYKFFDIVGHAYCTSYIYRCDQCGCFIDVVKKSS